MKPSTTEERIWAVISHLSALAFGMGILLPIIGWSEHRNRSKYASFQCLQALGYQSLGYTVWLLAYIVMVILFALGFALAAPGAGNDSTALRAWAVIFVLVILGSFGIYVLLPVIAAAACAFGKDFRYPILGNRLAGYLGYGPAEQAEEAVLPNQEHEDRWVAAMGHLSVIIVFWGLIAPLTTWIMQGKNNPFLKFQSIQTALYQLAVNIFYLGGILAYFVGLIPFFALTGLESDPNQGSPAAMIGLLLFLLFLLVASLILLIIPLFHILGQWAGYRVLKGDHYRYPLIGKMIERRFIKP